MSGAEMADDDSFQVLVVPADSALPMCLETVDPEYAYGQLTRLLGGGMLEAISGRSWTAYLDEEGKLKSLPYNSRANDMAAVLGWRGLPGDFLCGTVIFLGPPDSEGNDTGVPDFVVDLVPAPHI